MPSQKPVLIYDGGCSFCKIWIEYWKLLTGDRIDYAASHDVADQYPRIHSSSIVIIIGLVYLNGIINNSIISSITGNIE